MALKEEVQRETQEVGKLSRVGQGSLLSALSNLLGKKKELQDLELEVSAQVPERARRWGTSGVLLAAGHGSWWPMARRADSGLQPRAGPTVPVPWQRT